MWHRPLNTPVTEVVKNLSVSGQSSKLPYAVLSFLTYNSLLHSILARHHSILTTLLFDAKRAYEAEEQNRVQIFVVAAYNDWRRIGSRPKRPMESIVLDSALKDMLLNDVKEFLASESWYGERGIPFRRGYLLWGAPGTGKTSLIQSAFFSFFHHFLPYLIGNKRYRRHA